MSFTALAQTILKDAAILDEYISSRNLPIPSLDQDGPSQTLFTTQESVTAHYSLLANTHKLQHLARGPAAAWTGTVDGAYGDAMTAAAIYRFNIVNHVPIDEEVSFEEVAQKSGMALRDFEMVVRYAMTNFIFCEPRRGYIAHTAASRVLRENRLISSLMGMSSDEIFPAISKVVDALETYPGSEEPTESGWGLANNARVPMFEELGTQHPKRAETMAFAMETLGTMIPDSVIVDNYDWASLGTATVVDVGGGKGLACRQLAKHFPQLSFIVQDLEETAAAGRDTLPVEFKDRITYMTHDFLIPQPIKDADVYFFRAIIHDWPDKYCVQILRNLIPALKKGARVIVQDPHTPDPLAMVPWQDRQIRGSNLRMLLCFNAHDRETGEWPELFAKVDPRFRVVQNKVHSRASPIAPLQTFTTLEAIWEG